MIPENQTRYDIQVKNTSNFFANNVLVHNCRMLLFVFVSTGDPNFIVTTATSYSRNGKVFENFSNIEDQVRQKATALLASRLSFKGLPSNTLAHGFVLDGEVVSNSFQTLMKQARRKENVDADDSIYHVFDIIPVNDFRRGYWNASQSTRNELLESMRPVFEQMQNVKLLPHLDVNLDTLEGKNQLDRYAADTVAAGFEGILIKNVDAPYLCKRTVNWLKYKPVLTVDLTVVALEEGSGKHAGRLGALVCEGIDDGKFIRVNVGSGLSDTQRDEIWGDQNNIIGQVVEVKADCITKNQNSETEYSLRFPRFERFRGFAPGEKI